MKELIESLNKAFSEFKASNDERIKALETKGTVDPVLAEKVDKANNAITDIEAKIEAARKEQADRIDKLELDFQQQGLGGNNNAGSLELKNEAREFFTTMAGAPVRDDQVDVDGYLAYKQAFNTYLRRGDKALNNEVRNALSVGSDPDGGQWVPASTANKIIARIFETSPMWQYANVVTIGTDRLELPKDLESGTSGGWVGETQSRSETDTPQVGVQEIPVHEQYAMPQVTQKLLDDAQFPVETWLSAKVADILVRTENGTFVDGNGVMKPRGFIDYSGTAVTTEDADRAWGVLQYHFTGASAGFLSAASGAADCFIELEGKLKSAYRSGAVWAMNRFTKATIRTLKDEDGNYYLIPDLSGAGASQLIGYPVAEFDDMDDIGADSFSVAFGNFNVAYQIVDRVGIRVLRDPYTNKPYIRYYTTKRVGGDVVNFDALKLLKFGTS
jgi:HK97 family phage major capsid protein